jgi:hypothetical protein
MGGGGDADEGDSNPSLSLSLPASRMMCQKGPSWGEMTEVGKKGLPRE